MAKICNKSCKSQNFDGKFVIKILRKECQDLLDMRTGFVHNQSPHVPQISALGLAELFLGLFADKSHYAANKQRAIDLLSEIINRADICSLRAGVAFFDHTRSAWSRLKFVN